MAVNQPDDSSNGAGASYSIQSRSGNDSQAAGAGTAFAANANTDAKPIANNTAIADTPPSVIAEQYAGRFAKYKDYGLTYDKETDNLYFDGKLVRYFEDYYPVGGNGYAGVDYFNENGTLDAHGVRDLSQIIHNTDGSYDPSGKLMGVELYSQEEFEARDIDALKNPPLSLTTVYAAENAENTNNTQNQQQGNVNLYASAATASESGLNAAGKTIPQIFLEYKDYGVSFDENSVRGGLGSIYYQDQLVKTFIDEKPNGGVFMFTSFDDGSIKVRTVYDENEKLIGVEVFGN